MMKSRFAAIVAVAILLAVCRPVVTLAQYSSSSMVWSVRQLSDRKEPAGIPGLVADAAGVVHIFWQQHVPETNSNILYYGRFDGDKQEVTDIMAGDMSEPRVAVDHGGMLHLIWGGADGLRYSRSHVDQANLTKAWSEPAMLGEGIIGYQDIIASSDGALHVVYMRNDPLGDSSSAVYYLRSVDSGRTWSEPVIFEPARPDGAMTNPKLVIGDDGILHMVWSLVAVDEYYGGLGVYYVRSTDQGRTWTQPKRLDEETIDATGKRAWNASIAAVRANELHVVWDAHTESGTRYHQWSTDGGTTWTRPQPVWSEFISQTGPNPLVVDGDKNLYILTSGAADWDHIQGVYVGRWTGNHWTSPELVSTDTLGLGAHFMRVVVGGGNRLHLVWQALGRKPAEAWYATSTTPAFAQLAQPYPTIILPASTPTFPAPTLTPSPTAGPTRVANADPPISPTGGDQYRAMVAGIGSALLLAAIVIIWQRLSEKS